MWEKQSLAPLHVIIHGMVHSCSLHGTYRTGNSEWVWHFIGQMTLLIDENILKTEVDLKEIPLLSSSHSLRSESFLIEGESTCGKKFTKR